MQSILDLLDQTLVVLWVGSVADLLARCWSRVVALGDWVLRDITLSTRQGVVTTWTVGVVLEVTIAVVVGTPVGDPVSAGKVLVGRSESANTTCAAGRPVRSSLRDISESLLGTAVAGLISRRVESVGTGSTAGRWP